MTHYITLPNHYLAFTLYNNIESLRGRFNGIKDDIQKRILFLTNYIENPAEVGSIAPSSRWLSRKIVELIPENNQKGEVCRYLEVGPGTGPFTEEIVKRLRKNDELDLVELDPKFCAELKEKYKHLSNVHIHCKPLEEWHPEYQYDAIISGLPLNAFPSEVVETIIQSFKSLAKEKGTVSYFEYAFLPTINKSVLFGEKGKNFQKVLEIKDLFYKTFGRDKEFVLWNLPPARVLHFEIKRTDESVSAI